LLQSLSTPCLCWWLAGLIWMGALRSRRV